MASVAQQRFLIQKETTPGTPAVNAMRAYRGLRAMPAFNDEGESFRARGFRGVTARIPTLESATVNVEAPQCFNAILPVAASVIGSPVTTQPDPVEAATAYQHVFTLMGSGSRNPVTYTSQWGDSANALQLAYTVFNQLTIGIQRSSLTFETGAIAREPNHAITLASTGIVDVPAVPIPARAYDVYMDDLFADVGNTQLLACYDLSVAIGETWAMDTPINSAIASFASLVENEEIDFSGSAQIGFDAVAKGLITTFKNGATKAVRIAATGPVINGTIAHALTVDFSIIITSRGEMSTAPNSPTVVLPFNYELTPDPVSGKLLELTLVNTLATV